MTTAEVVGSANAERRRWISILAKAQPFELEEAWEGLPERPTLNPIRRPETGLVLVRGRAGGTGDAFNLGEMTVTRAAVRLEDGVAGIGYVAGRNKRHAELAAAVDAMMQSQRLRPLVEDAVIERLAGIQQARKLSAARKAAATKVDFFTMTRTREPK
jgi:alpha-D-ribose 1-methylphosphonate 5-triphosphate synthase subunit PhnG